MRYSYVKIRGRIDIALSRSLFFQSLAKVLPGRLRFTSKETKDCPTILDLGCGSYSVIPLVSGSKFTVGVDILRERLMIYPWAKSHSGFLQADVRYLPFRPKSFDCVVMFELLEHLERDEALCLLASSEEIAKKKILLSTPNGFAPVSSCHTQEVDKHRAGFTAAELKQKGFKVRGTEGIKGFQGPYIRAVFIPLMLLLWVVAYFLPERAYDLMAQKDTQAEGADPGT